MIELKPFTDKKMVLVGDRKKYSKIMKAETLRWSSKAGGWPIPMNRVEYFQEFVNVLNNKDHLESIKEHGDTRENPEEPVKRFHRANSDSGAEEKLEEIKARYVQSPGVRTPAVDTADDNVVASPDRPMGKRPSPRRESYERPWRSNRYERHEKPERFERAERPVDRYERYERPQRVEYMPRYPPHLERSHGYARDYYDYERYERIPTRFDEDIHPRRPIQDPYERSPRRGYEYRDIRNVRDSSPRRMVSRRRDPIQPKEYR